MLASKTETAVMSVFGVTGATTRMSPASATSPLCVTAKRVRRRFAVERISITAPMGRSRPSIEYRMQPTLPIYCICRRPGSCGIKRTMSGRPR